VERHVDLWTKHSAVHSTPAASPAHDEGPRPQRGTRASTSGYQRQRIDMINPATMAPKPMAKFQAPSETMIGMRSPAT
jgi:hypothetical protein